MHYIGALASLAAKMLAEQMATSGSSSTTKMLARGADCPKGKLTLTLIPLG
jgi:hypothetical protein